MRDEPWIEELREAVRRDSERPAEEIWDDLVLQGIIDEEGNVLIRMPQPPGRAKTTRKKAGKPPAGNGEAR